MTSDGRALQYATKELQADAGIVLAAVAQNGHALRFASAALRDDPHVVLTALGQDGLAFQFASAAIRADPDVVLKGVIKNGGVALRYAAEELRSNPAIVLEMVKSNGRGLRYAANELRSDPTIALAAVTQNGSSLQFVDVGLRGSADIIEAALHQSGKSLQYVAGERRSDPETILAAAAGCRGDVESLRYMLRYVGDDVATSPSLFFAVLGRFQSCTAAATLPEDRGGSGRKNVAAAPAAVTAAANTSNADAASSVLDAWAGWIPFCVNPVGQWGAFCAALSPSLSALLNRCKADSEVAASIAGGPIHRHDSAPSDELKVAPLLHHKLRWLARVATNFMLLGVEPAAITALQGSKTMEVLLDINSRFVRGHRKALANTLAQTCTGGAAAVAWLENEVVPAVSGNTVAKMVPMAVALAAICATPFSPSTCAYARTDPASRVTELEAATSSLHAEVAIFLRARVAAAAARVGLAATRRTTSMLSQQPMPLDDSAGQSGALGSAECWGALLSCKARFKVSDTDGRSALDALMALGRSQQLLPGQKMALLEKACRGLATATAARHRHQQLLGRLSSMKQVLEVLVSDSGAQLVAELFRTNADAWHTIFPQHFINMVFPRSNAVGGKGTTASASHAHRVAGITAALKVWRGRDQLLGYAARHSRDPVVMANLRVFAERLSMSEEGAAADRYSTAGERGEHLAAVFGCDGHEDLQAKWSAPVASRECTSFAEFQARGGVDFSAALGGGTVEERVATAAHQVRALLRVSLIVDKHVEDAATWLPKCIGELDDTQVSAPCRLSPTDATNATNATRQQQLTHQLDIMLVDLLSFDPAAAAAASGELEDALAEQRELVDGVVEQLKALVTLKFRPPTTNQGSQGPAEPAKLWEQFLNDVQDIAKSLKRSIVAIDDYDAWTVGITDDANMLFMIGTDVAGSCQHATGSPALNKCLMSYVLDGKTKATVISRPGTRPGEQGKPVTIGRCIVRLVLHNAAPALVVSRLYVGSKYRSENIRRMFGAALQRFVGEEAARLGVKVVRPGDPGIVLSLGGVGPEYVDESDGAKIKNDGKWELSTSQLEG